MPIGAPLHAFYAAAAIYQNEPILLDLPDGTELALIGDFDSAEGRLTLTPPDALAPLAGHTIHWPELRGTTSGGKGLGKKVTFTTGAGMDVTAPVFEGVTALSWDRVRETDDCTDKIEDRLAFDVALGEANDDGGRDSLTLVLSQTAGPRLGNGPRQIFIGPLPPPGKPAHVSLAVDGAVGRICFAALVRDLTDRISGGGDREVCVQTTRPPFFYGCALGTSAHRERDPCFILGALGFLLLYYRRGWHAR